MDFNFFSPHAEKAIIQFMHGHNSGGNLSQFSFQTCIARVYVNGVGLHVVVTRGGP